MNVIKRNAANGFPIVMDQFFKDILGGTQYNHAAVPLVNIKETETSFSLELIAPGLKKESFNIEIEKDLLTISSETKAEKNEEQEGKFTRREFRTASFKRSFKLPENIKAEEINAAYQDGILNITLPKKEAAAQPAKRLIDIS
ncbi:Hsp20/alpha crystallin family protein [Flavobacterium sp. DG1-102-2]|uniref:Hsp20/alpha crystallin family protein n=1 Tax=Flavobacterium sp. DG1-102-2 TaxID=3081663 RepID=UPI002948FD14|nr:Hsp20/alpha crystallin family protein [Flavobacterium sp. DG1-102-2]MDV6168440.1 Hsp20/alpha crystallin family protein [Flavobacterium sp. DG1-102-2]